jgi:hypothetical protein
MTIRSALVASAAFAVLSLSAAGVAATDIVAIGTGGVTGVYYPTGGAICRMVNKNKKKHGVRCLVESTAGSVHNINTIRAGELDMGIAQSDWQYHAYHGSGEKSFIEAGPFKDLRAVFSVHGEPVTIIARADSGIKHVDDLVGKRVNIGNPGSGTEATWNLMWETMGHADGKADLGIAAQLKSVETPQALCDNKIDALFFLVGHPNGLSKEATTTCDAVMVEVTGPAVDKLVEDTPFYRYATIPGGMYRGYPNDTKAFGVGATVVSSTRTSENTVYVVTKAVFDNFDAFKKLHPAFANLKESEMIKDALSAPIHPGAMKYYKERGWM